MITQERNHEMKYDYIGEGAFQTLQKNGIKIDETHQIIGADPKEIEKIVAVRIDHKSDFNWDYDILISCGHNDRCRNGFRRL